jgi:hypothetical protein
MERTLDGMLPRAARDTMVREIERTLGFVGSVSGVGRSVHWSGQLPGFVGRDIRVTVSSADEETVIHVEEHIELRGGSIFVPAWGAAAGVIVSLIAMGIGVVPDYLLPFVAVPLGIGSAVTTVSQVIGQLTRKRRPELEALTDRLAARAAGAIGGGRTDLEAE